MVAAIKLHAQPCDPAPNIDVDWEYHINNINDDDNDIPYDIEAIDDNSDGDIDGFVVVGSTETGDDQKQAWIIRLNTDGTWIGGDSWIVDVGEDLNDWAQAVEQVDEEKIVVVGTKRSSTFGAGNNDNVWLLEIALSDGEVLSEHEYGDVGHDRGYDVKVDPSTGYYVIAAMAGKYKDVDSDDLDDEEVNALGVYWVLEVDPDSYNIQWDDTFFGENVSEAEPDAMDIARSIVIDAYGNYVVTGSCKSCDEDEWHDEFMTVKIDPSNSYSATEEVDGYPAKDQVGWNIIETDDGGYLTCGITHPSGMPSCLNAHNFHVIKHNSSLGDTWSPGCQLYDGVTFGGNKEDNAYCGVQACDGEFIIVGSTKSKSNEEDVTCNSDDSETTTDGWVLKINSSGVKVWDESFGNDAKNDAIYCIKRLHDGSYIMAGEFGSTADPSTLQDFYVIKFQLKDCDPPTNLDASSGGSCIIVFDWDGTSCSYLLKYKKTGTSTWTEVTVSDSEYETPELAPGDYTWGVRAKCSPDYTSSLVTSSSNFTACRIGIENAGGEKPQLSVFPNPSNGSFRAMLSLPGIESQEAYIELFELEGRLAYSFVRLVENEVLDHQIGANSLPVGSYILKVTVGSKNYRSLIAIQ